MSKGRVLVVDDNDGIRAALMYSESTLGEPKLISISAVSRG